MNIVSRTEWGAQEPQGPKIPLPTPDLFLHHDTANFTAVDETSERKHMLLLERTGKQRFGSTVSYSLVVFPSGRVYEGAGVGRKGTHTANHNSTGHGVVVVGNFETQTVPQRTVDLLRQLHADGITAGWWTGQWTPHRAVKATACPGKNLFARLADLNAPHTPPKEDDAMTPAQEAQLAEVRKRIDHANSEIRTVKQLIVDLTAKLDKSHPGSN